MKDLSYKLAHLDKKQIAAAARKALIVADADYYTWSLRKQEYFRATLGDGLLRKIQCVLLDNLLDIHCSINQVDEVWDDIPVSSLNPLNWACLLATGIGEDYIYLNEHMADGKTLLDFPTLYDYDYADYVCQEKLRKQEFVDYKGIDYYAFQHPSWVRLLIQERFYYGTFTSLSTYMIDEIESAGNDVIRQLIPHEYVDGKNHGKREKGGFLWDIEIDAAGRELELDELNRRWFAYQHQCRMALCEANVQRPSRVYVCDKDWDDDPQRVFVFTNEETLKQIRWRHFLSDCEPLMAEYTEVEALLVEEVERANAWLVESYQDIQENFDPTVVKLRKKRKIIISEDALDDLEEMDGDNEPLQ